MFENFKTCNFILCKVNYFVFKYIWYSLVQWRTSAQMEFIKEILKNRMYRHFDQNLVYKMSFKISFNYSKPKLFWTILGNGNLM